MSPQGDISRHFALGLTVSLQMSVHFPPTAAKILMVDDEPIVVQVTQRILEMGGYEVKGVQDSLEALHLFENGRWDAVITDRAMPIMDGEELAVQIHQRSPQTPIILITGFPDLVIHPERFFTVIRKPFTATELYTQISRMLSQTAQ